MKHLYEDWLKLAKNYFEDENTAQSLWNSIYKNYSTKNRYYHSLKHISSMLDLAKENKSEILNYDEVIFAIWFHDIIYKSSSKKNEEKSAEFAKSALKIINQKLDLEIVCQLIISTKKHQILLKENKDNAFLLDFDLSILGSEWNIYQKYIENIRKEYKIYPDFLYNPARKKVLESFLIRGKLFFTGKYQDLFEEKARENLQKEIKLLS